MDILVTVICTAYNHEKYIRKAIDGFINQKTNFKYEIIIHDDASTDNTARIIKEYEGKYPDLINAIYQEENQYSKGVKISHELCKIARGKYIALCEGDDYWCCADKLQKQVDYMENHPECELCCHAAYMCNEQGDIIKEPFPTFTGECVFTIEDYLTKVRGIPTASVLKRKIEDEIPQFVFQAPVGDYPNDLLCLTRGTGYFFEDKMSVYRLAAVGSWSKRYASNLEMRKSVSLKWIEMLELFNDYTNYRYDNIINDKITEERIKLMLNSGQWRKVRKDYKREWAEYSLKNRLIYININRMEKIRRILNIMKR